MDLTLMVTSLPKLLSATVVTLKLLSLSLFFGLIIGLLFAILRYLLVNTHQCFVLNQYQIKNFLKF